MRHQENSIDTPTARAFSANPLFSLLRMGLRGAESVAPRWAPQVAAQLFCTPVPTKLSSRRFKTPHGVRVESIPFERASLTLYHWPAPEGAPQVLLTHGWGGWGMQMAALADALSEIGWAAVVIDQPGHGRSTAWSSTLPQFARALTYAAARLGRVEGIVAHSMGGSAAALAVANGLSVRKLVLISSTTSIVQITRDYADIFGLNEATRAAMVRRLESREGILLERMDARHTAPRINLPTLVLHDRDDATVPYAEGERLAQQLPDARLFTTEGLGHRRILRDARVIEEVRRFWVATS